MRAIVRLGELPPLLWQLLARTVSGPRTFLSLKTPDRLVGRSFNATALRTVDTGASDWNDTGTVRALEGLSRGRIVNRVQQFRAALNERNPTTALALYEAIRTSQVEEEFLRKEDYVRLLDIFGSSPRGFHWTFAFPSLLRRNVAARESLDIPEHQWNLSCDVILSDMLRRGLLPGPGSVDEIAGLPHRAARTIAFKVVSGLLDSGKTDDAHHFLSQLRTAAPKLCPINAYAALITALEGQGKLNLCAEVFRTIPKRAVVPTSLYTTMISVARTLNDVSLMKRIWAEGNAVLPGSLRTEAWNTLLALVAGSSYFHAFNLFRKVAEGRDSSVIPDLDSYRIMIQNAPTVDKAMDAFNLLLENELEPNSTIVGALIEVWCRFNVGEAWRLATTARKSFGVEPDQSAFLAIYKALVREGDENGMHKVLDYLDARGMKPAPAFYTETLRRLMDRQDVHGIDTALEKMTNEGISVNLEALLFLVRFYAERWDLSRLDELIAQARGEKDPEQVCKALAEVYRAKMDTEAEASPRLAETLAGAAFPFATFDSSGCNSQKLKPLAARAYLFELAFLKNVLGARDLFSRIEEPDLICWNWLLVAHFWAGDHPGLEMVYEDMRRQQFEPDAWTWSLLAAAFSGQDFERALDYFDKLLAVSPNIEKRAWGDRAGYAAGNILKHAPDSFLIELTAKLDSSGALRTGALNIELTVRDLAWRLISCDPGLAEAVYKLLPSELQTVVKDVYRSAASLSSSEPR